MDVEILIGERPGGAFSCHLLIEQDGVEYQQAPWIGGTRPVLPVFKTMDIPEEFVEQMKIDPDVATLEGNVYGVLK